MSDPLHQTTDEAGHAAVLDLASRLDSYGEPPRICRDAAMVMRGLSEELKRARAALRWAAGEGESDFGERVPEGADPYWWRREMMERAGLWPRREDANA